MKFEHGEDHLVAGKDAPEETTSEDVFARESETRRLVEPSPSSELRAAAADAVRESMALDAFRRLDLIADVARELGGEVGARIRALADVNTPVTGTSVRAGEDIAGPVYFAGIDFAEREAYASPLATTETERDGFVTAYPSLTKKMVDDYLRRAGLAPREVSRTGEVLESADPSVSIRRV